MYGYTLDKEEKNEGYKNWNAFYKVKLWCKKCKCKTESTSLNIIKKGYGVACFCSKKMSLTNPQYYKCIQNKELCLELGCYEGFHREVAPIEMPTWDVWYASAKLGNCAKITLKCSRCNCETKSTSLRHLQCGKGIMCFCSKKNESN